MFTIVYHLPVITQAFFAAKDTKAWEPELTKRSKGRAAGGWMWELRKNAGNILI